MPNAYLTIDDSPSAHTVQLVDFLKSRNIPAILFVRGALLEQNPRPIEYAIQNGILNGNHSYAHKPAGDMEPQEWADDLELCDHLIEAAYSRVNITRPAKCYRFPYIDRGDGVKLEQIDTTTLKETNTTSILQQYLHDQGFHQPFKNMPPNYPTRAQDCLYTFTSRDWMITDTHRGKHLIKTTDDLISRIDNDQALNNETHNHVIIMHDQPGLLDPFCTIIDYLLEKQFKFLDF